LAGRSFCTPGYSMYCTRSRSCGGARVGTSGGITRLNYLKKKKKDSDSHKTRPAPAYRVE
jgi:hypothetical protein